MTVSRSTTGANHLPQITPGETTAKTLPQDGIAAGSILRCDPNGNFECVTDELAVEEPLEIRVNDEPLAISMRTPGYDGELAAGFLLSEGIIHRNSDLKEVRLGQLSEPNVVNVSVSAEAKRNLGRARRFGTISSSCGLCGKHTIASIRRQFPPLSRFSSIRVPIPQLLALPGRLRPAQTNFERTGGIHAAAIFDLRSEDVIFREDIGRHNAVDKAIGRALLDQLTPLQNHLLLVSGRSSLEIMQKALSAGIPIVASISAPSTLAVNFARQAGQTLIGFLRPPAFNVYSHAERIDPGCSRSS